MLGRLESSISYRYKVSIALTHPALPAAELGRALPFKASHEGTVGEPRRSPTGQALPGVYKESFWRCSLTTPADGELEGFIANVVEQLAATSPHALVDGGKARLFIGLFMEQDNIGLELCPELLSRCGALGISLGFDIYGPDPSGAAA